MSSPDLRSAEVLYPESDGQPMGESETHIRLLLDLLAAALLHFRDQPDMYVFAAPLCARLASARMPTPQCVLEAVGPDWFLSISHPGGCRTDFAVGFFPFWIGPYRTRHHPRGGQVAPRTSNRNP